MRELNILFCGDIVGKSGRLAIETHLSTLQQKYNIDFTIINAENSAHGFGITTNIAQDLLKQNIDCITLGNHSFDKQEIIEYLSIESKILRPLNYIDNYPNPFGVYDIKGYKLLVANLLGKLFMHSKIKFSDPFESITKLLEIYKLTHNINGIFVDFHAETTSEKNAMGHYLDGKISALIGTHSHIPTSDFKILPKGSGYQSDVGMCGDYNSVIGMDVSSSLNIFLNSQKSKLQPSNNEGTLCGTFIQIDTSNGLCKKIKHLQIGGSLQNNF